MRTLTYERMLERHRHARHLAERITRKRWRRADEICRESGIAPHDIGTAGHNALVDFKAGKPWSSVNYAKLRQAQHMYAQASVPLACVRGMWARLYEQWAMGGFAYEQKTS